LSNFYPAPVEMWGQLYPSVEAAYQAAKCANADDRLQFQNDRLPAGGAKKLGREVEIRSDWEDVKFGIMERLVARKFEIPVLQRRLLETDDAKLVEGNYWGDTTWGVDLKTGKGENRLGIILTVVRCTLREGLNAVA
jgi:ribA/ribD-fused uncharacterized protein